MDKMLKNEQSKKEDNYNKPVNKWLREYLEQISPGYGQKVNSDKKFAEKCKIKYNRIRNITNGNAQVNIEDLIKISKATNVSCDEILAGKSNIKKITPNEIDIFSKEAYDVLLKHTTANNSLFAFYDSFIMFLNFIICEENFVNTLSKKSQKILEDFKNSDIKLDFTRYEKYEEFKDKLNNKELNEKIMKLITDKKIREDTREIVQKYIYKELKNNIFNS